MGLEQWNTRWNWLVHHNEPLEYNTVRLGLALMWQGSLLFLTTYSPQCHSLSISTLQIRINVDFLYEFINIEVYLFKMWGFLLSSVLHHWTETYSNILTSVCGFGNCWELGIGLSKSANTDLPVLQQSLYCLFAWNWNLVHSLLIGLEVLWRLNF